MINAGRAKQLPGMAVVIALAVAAAVLTPLMAGGA